MWFILTYICTKIYYTKLDPELTPHLFRDMFEFPKSRLKLGKQLGCGAFGRVLKAEATGNNNVEMLTVHCWAN